MAGKQETHTGINSTLLLLLLLTLVLPALLLLLVVVLCVCHLDCIFWAPEDPAMFLYDRRSNLFILFIKADIKSLGSLFFVKKINKFKKKKKEKEENGEIQFLGVGVDELKEQSRISVSKKIWQRSCRGQEPSSGWTREMTAIATSSITLN